MNELALEELISAYLDGELTSDEQALVERALVESERCRQVHDEFVALRGSLQSLPREQLDANFTGRVLERIRALPASAMNPTNGRVDASEPIADENIHGLSAATHNNAPSSAQLRAKAEHSRFWYMGKRTAGLFLTAAAVLLFGFLISQFREEIDWLNPDRSPTAINDSVRPNHVIPDEGPSPLDSSQGLAKDQVTSSNTKPRKTIDGAEATAASTNATTNQIASEANHGAMPETSRSPNLPIKQNSSESQNTQEIARAGQPAPDEKTNAPTSITGHDLVIDYGDRNLHVIRLAVREQVLRTGAFDQLLEKEGVSFLGGGAISANATTAPADEGTSPAKAAGLDVNLVLVKGVPGQIEGLLNAVRSNPGDYKTLAVYTAPTDRILDWMLAVVENLPSAPKTPLPNPSVQPPLDVGGAPRNPWDEYLQMQSSGKVQDAYAWRAPPLSPQLLDRFFPPPQVTTAQRSRLNANQVSPDLSVQVMFALFSN